VHSAYIELRVAAWSTTKIGCPIPDARRSPLRVNCSRFGESSPDLRLTGSRLPNDPLGILGRGDPAEYLWARLSAVTWDLASVTLRRGAMIVPLCGL